MYSGPSATHLMMVSSGSAAADHPGRKSKRSRRGGTGRLVCFFCSSCHQEARREELLFSNSGMTYGLSESDKNLGGEGIEVLFDEMLIDG